MKYFFHIAFRGKNYHGWQKNGKVMSVQQMIEEKLEKVLKSKIEINGCGRTDAQVNASQFFFHANLNQEWNETILFRVNKILPDDISIFEVIPVKEKAHARFDAVQRQYDYFIHTYKDPFLSEISSLYLDLKIDVESLKQATEVLTKYQDFRCFCTTPDKNEHTICQVSSAKWLVSANGERLRFQISSNRFLGKMVRIIVGQLLRVATNDLSVEDFENYLIQKETPKILFPAHPQGLYLSKVVYPYLDLQPKSDFFNLNLSDNNWRELT